MTPEIAVEKGVGTESSDSEPCCTKQAGGTSALGCSKSEEVSTGAEPMHLDTEAVSVSQLPNGHKAPSPLENLGTDCRDQDNADPADSGVALTSTRDIPISENGSTSIEGDGSNGFGEEMANVDVVDAESGSSTALENRVYCNGKAPGAPIPEQNMLM